MTLTEIKEQARLKAIKDFGYHYSSAVDTDIDLDAHEAKMTELFRLMSEAEEAAEIEYNTRVTTRTKRENTK